MIKSPNRTSVLIVGGGLVGLSAGLFFHHHGIPFILLEKQQYASLLPRARGIHMRTMELFRQIGVEDAVCAVAAAAWKQGGFGGARQGKTLVDAEPIVDMSVMKASVGASNPSPSMFAACPQTVIERILRERLEARGGDLRFGHEMTSFNSGDTGVSALVREPGGALVQVEADWLIGADGARSTVRRGLGIDTVNTAASQHLVNIFFRADLTTLVEGRTFSQCEIANDRVRGLFLAMNNADLWSFHLEYDMIVGPPSETMLPDLIRAAIGVDDIPVEVLSHTTWGTGAAIAARYRSGRSFLCGDAAHLMPPWGGFNATAGIADAHNLAWKIAAVASGAAKAALLDTYESERRPLALVYGQQAMLRTDFQARFGVETPANRASFVQLIGQSALLLRYRYPDRTLEPHEESAVFVELLQAQVGTRFPHAWIIRAGVRMSTLDLFGSGYVRLAGPRVLAPGRPPDELSDSLLIEHVCGRDFTLVDNDMDWHTLTALAEDGWATVRPDGFVLRRSDSEMTAPPNRIPRNS